MSGKSQIFRERLMSWWQRWDSGYRGPMPYVVGPGYRVKSRHPRASWVHDLWRDWDGGSRTQEQWDGLSERGLTRSTPG